MRAKSRAASAVMEARPRRQVVGLSCGVPTMVYQVAADWLAASSVRAKGSSKSVGQRYSKRVRPVMSVESWWQGPMG